MGLLTVLLTSMSRITGLQNNESQIPNVPQGKTMTVKEEFNFGKSPGLS